MDGFTLNRQSDDVVYLFERATHPQAGRAYKRSDGGHWIIQHAKFGWVAWDFATQTVMGRPWDVLPEQQGPVPPEGIWVSRKGPKSYVYDLIHTPNA